MNVCGDSQPGQQRFLLEARDLTFGYGSGPTFLGPIDLQVAQGQLWGVIGPNGAGKSTLLRLLVGLLSPRGGTVLLDGEALAQTSVADRARQIAFVPQNIGGDYSSVARDIVLLGRFPHRRWRLFESPEDHRLAEQAMQLTDTLHLANRRLDTLSGGEAQCVHLAAALAQQPRLMVLDEPTSSLDLYHQQLIFLKLRGLSRDQGIGVIVVTHDINLAGQFCDRLLILHDGKQVACGPCEEVLRSDMLRSVYEVDLRTVRVPGCARDWLLAVGPDEGSQGPVDPRMKLPFK
ncbi:MAG: ABC transporter ATP-binding protein [Planctomycetes bacterium]|nr:ABC transporter ATP-binding protein [Planctomycetota bacterium]